MRTIIGILTVAPAFSIEDRHLLDIIIDIF